MCSGGRLLADLTLGTCERPDVPEVVEPSLTTTVDSEWVIWAHKVARHAGHLFRPLTGGDPYPADAVAECRCGMGHPAPQPGCTCGFHAVSHAPAAFIGGPTQLLDVALSGRVLVFEWHMEGLLFRAERQTVARVVKPDPEPRFPDDPDGFFSRVVRAQPRGSGPLRLQLPRQWPQPVAVDDDVGYCVLRPAVFADA